MYMHLCVCVCVCECLSGNVHEQASASEWDERVSECVTGCINEGVSDSVCNSMSTVDCGSIECYQTIEAISSDTEH